MTGQKMTIAKMTVKAVLDTLSDDDFFNVIVVSSMDNSDDVTMMMTITTTMRLCVLFTQSLLPGA